MNSNRAFTLVELLVVIAIIKKWMDPTVLGYNHVDHDGYPAVGNDLDWILNLTTAHQ